MSTLNKYRVAITIIIAFIFFISVIVLTNDYFDDLENRTGILLTLTISQLVIAMFNLFFAKKEVKE